MAQGSYLQGPQMDCMEDERPHKRYSDWQEEVNLILAALLSKESKTLKANYVLIWVGETARHYFNSRPGVDKADPMKPLEELQDWNKPKSNEIAVFTSLRTLNQRTLSLSDFITEATRLVDECGYTTDCDTVDKHNSLRYTKQASIPEMHFQRKRPNAERLYQDMSV